MRIAALQQGAGRAWIGAPRCVKELCVVRIDQVHQIQQCAQLRVLGLVDQQQREFVGVCRHRDGNGTEGPLIGRAGRAGVGCRYRHHGSQAATDRVPVDRKLRLDQGQRGPEQFRPSPGRRRCEPVHRGQTVAGPVRVEVVQFDLPAGRGVAVPHGAVGRPPSTLVGAVAGPNIGGPGRPGPPDPGTISMAQDTRVDGVDTAETGQHQRAGIAGDGKLERHIGHQRGGSGQSGQIALGAGRQLATGRRGSQCASRP